MDRPDGPDVAATPPAFPTAGTPGYFTDGDEVLGPEPTVVRAWHLHSLFEEIRNVIVAAGITPVRTTLTQLRDAIRLLGFSTGDVKLTFKTAADAGWVMCNDGTIGSASSGASTRANADTEALYTLLWNNVSNAYAPVSTGRGASAAADFAANKTLGLTRMLGRALALSGTGAGLTARALGETVGAETHTLSFDELPNEAKNFSLFPDPVNHDGSDEGDRTIIVASVTSGGGDPHNNMQPTSFLNAMVKL